MIPPTCPQNINSASPDAAKPISSHTRQALHTALPSTSFRSDPPHSSHLNLFNRSDPPPPVLKKPDKEPVGEFLWRGICRRMGTKDLLHVW